MREVIDLTKENTAAIPCNFETYEEAEMAAADADDILADLKKIRAAAAVLDSTVDTLYKRARATSAYTAQKYFLQEVLTEDSEIYNEASALLASVDTQIARYTQFFKDAENKAAELGSIRAATRKYGSHEDQVRGER